MTAKPPPYELEPPYPAIRAALLNGKVIPFLGSGASLGQRSLNSAWEKCKATNENELKCYLEKIGDECTGGYKPYLPKAGELSCYLARLTNFPKKEGLDLAKVAQYYELVMGRAGLDTTLREIFVKWYDHTSVHSYLASIDKPLLIVTTNYDYLIESAFEAAGRPYDLVIYTTAVDLLGDQLYWWRHGEKKPEAVYPKDIDIDLETRTVIYKMHGAVDRDDPERDQYVITEDDYVTFMTRVTRNKAAPPIFADPFQTRHFLFLGYSLNDWNLRVLFNYIDKNLRVSKSIKSWAIQNGPRPLERTIWQERGVRLYDMLLEDFIAQLR
jgi:SIR2-like domain